MNLISNKDIPINFRTKYIDELSELKHAQASLQDTLQKISENYSEEVGVGSLVNATSDDGEKYQGRVWNIHDNGLIGVNRLGYKSLMFFKRKSVKNLSVGVYGKLEQALWVINEKIAEMGKALDKSDLPECFLIKEISIIKITKVVSFFQLEKVSFVNSVNLISYEFTLPAGLVHESEYCQVTVKNGDIKSIIKTDQFVFERYAGTK